MAPEAYPAAAGARADARGADAVEHARVAGEDQLRAATPAVDGPDDARVRPARDAATPAKAEVAAVADAAVIRVAGHVVGAVVALRVQPVGARAARDLVHPAARPQEVPTEAAVEAIVPVAGEQHIRAAGALELVGAPAALELVGAVVADQHVVLVAADHVLEARHVVPVGLAAGGREVDVQGDRVPVPPDQVAPRAAVEPVTVDRAVLRDRVVAALAKDRVDAVSAAEEVRPGAARDAVVPRTAVCTATRRSHDRQHVVAVLAREVVAGEGVVSRAAADGVATQLVVAVIAEQVCVVARHLAAVGAVVQVSHEGGGLGVRRRHADHPVRRDRAAARRLQGRPCVGDAPLAQWPAGPALGVHHVDLAGRALEPDLEHVLREPSRVGVLDDEAGDGRRARVGRPAERHRERHGWDQDAHGGANGRRARELRLARTARTARVAPRWPALRPQSLALADRERPGPTEPADERQLDPAAAAELVPHRPRERDRHVPVVREAVAPEAYPAPAGAGADARGAGALEHLGVAGDVRETRGGPGRRRPRRGARRAGVHAPTAAEAAVAAVGDPAVVRVAGHAVGSVVALGPAAGRRPRRP